MRLSARGGIALAGILLVGIPFLKLPAFYESFLYLVFHWIVLATSWNILSGYTGYFSFGHGAFFGAGIYTSATLMSPGPVAAAAGPALFVVTTILGFSGAEFLICAGTSNTASRAPSRATWMIIRPADTTSPGSAPRAVTTPATLDTRRV